MTQLDLPQVSLTRYVDLLRRRRWQVIPVSLLGLLIGGVVAFFIPRFFVATAAIAYQQPPGQMPENREDPFGGVIDSAKLTIPLAIRDTIQDLAWPEAVADKFELSQNVDEIEERLEIREVGSSKGRDFALIRVSYRDRDGIRAANFLNKLVATWIAQRLDELRVAAERERAAAAEEHTRNSQAYDEFVEDRRDLTTSYRIDPIADIALQRELHRSRTAQHEELVGRLGDQRSEVATLEATLANRKAKRLETPERIPVDMAELQKEVAKTKEGQALILQIAMDTIARDMFRKTNPNWARIDRRIAASSQLLLKIKPPGFEIDEAGTVPNPQRAALLAEIEQLELRLGVAEAEVAQLERSVEAQRNELARQAEGYALYEKNAERLAAAKTALGRSAKRIAEADATLGQLTNQPTIRLERQAQVPPAPTEPNLVLVALLGCVIGLFAATALILLLDVLRGSFKTVEDVERSLDVPVLGGVSHLETDFQRRTAARARRRATLFAAAVLVLVSVVVLLYYYDPTRLPPFVRDMLAMVLGDA